MNPYRNKAFDYYGPKMTVDTTRPFTVVTSFPADKKGKLTTILRYYIQDGEIIEMANIDITGPMTEEYCAANGAKEFTRLGGMVQMGDAMTRGMVLAMSIWWDEGTFMHWLDSEIGRASCRERVF